MSRKKRVDINQNAIAQCLKAAGLSVAYTHMVGQGFPDIIVGYKGLNFLFEIKNPEQSPSKRKLTEDEETFHKSWRGNVHIIEYAEDAIKIIKKGKIPCK